MSQFDESTPLIRTLDDNEQHRPFSGVHTKPSNYVWRIAPLAVVMLLLDTSNYLSVGPETAIFERIACHSYYGVKSTLSTIDERRCKTGPVQSEVAFVIAWNNALQTIPGILCALPFGTLADRIGRRKVLLISIVGCFLSDSWVRLVCYFAQRLSLRLVLLSGVWQFFGGGATTVSSIVWVIIADQTPLQERASAFSLIQAVFLVSEFIAVAVSAPLMNVNPWIPYLIASGCMLLGIVLAVIWVPESFPQRDEVPKTSKPTSQQLSEILKWTRNHKNVLLVLLFILLIQTGQQIVNLLLQYASYRFSWTLSQAAYLTMIRSLTSLVLLMAMPVVVKLTTTRPDGVTIVSEKQLTQISGLFLVIGTIVSFAAINPTILVSGQILFGLGSACTVMARTLVTAMVEQGQTGRLYGAIAVATYSGIMTGGPFLAQAFTWGLHIGGIWVGLPYLVAAGLFVLALMTLSIAGTGPTVTEAIEVDND